MSRLPLPCASHKKGALCLRWLRYPLAALAGLLFCLSQLSSIHAQQVDWAKSSWGLGNAEGYGVAVAESGATVVTGTFQGTVIFGRNEPSATSLTSVGNADIFIARYAANGDLLWAKAVGAAGYDRGNAVALEPQGNSYVIGHFVGVATFGEGPAARTLTSSGSGDLFLAKLDSAGNFLWVEQASGSIGALPAIAVAADGGSYVTGSFAGTATFAIGTATAATLHSNGDTDLFVARFDANGELLWVNQAGGSAADSGRGIALDEGGYSYVTGTFAGAATFGAATPQAITLTSSGGADLFVARYAANGDLLWVTKAGTSDNDYAQAIAVDDVGNSTVTGAQGSQLYVARYAVDGSRLWVGAAGGGSSSAWGNAVAVDAAGNSYVVGGFTGGTSFSFVRGSSYFVQFGLKNSGTSDGFLATYNAAGTQMWGRAMGGSLYDTAYGIAVDRAGNSAVTGSFMNAATIYPLALSGPGTQLFVAHFAPTTQPITVNTAADPGDSVCSATECTLREALTLANDWLLGENTIAFNIPGPGPHTIRPIGNLPNIVDRLSIDGYTQPGAQPNTNPMSEPINATILIEIDGSRAPSGFYFTGASSDSHIRGVALNRFGQAIGDARSTTIEGNFIGTDPSGSQALGNAVGIDTAGGVGGAHTTIGGANPAARNLIAGNNVGVRVGSLSYSSVAGNFIGTDATGTQPLANQIGVSSFIVLDAGGQLTLRGNLISGNGVGANLTNVCCTVSNNLFGVDRTGLLPLPNLGDGLIVAPYDLAISNNLFAYNGGSGIRVREASGPNTLTILQNRLFANGAAGITVTGNRAFTRITENLIDDNGTLGIDLGDDGVTLNDAADSDSGPNLRQNYPELRLAGSNGTDTVIHGAINSTPLRTLTLEFFANHQCDVSGYGEGEAYLTTQAVTTDANGNTPFTVNLRVALPAGQALTATATDFVNLTGQGEAATSEFSRCQPVATPVNNSLAAAAMTTSYNPTPLPNAPGGVFTLRATFVNQSSGVLRGLFFKVVTLTNNNVLLNAEGVPGGVGALLSQPEGLAPGAWVIVDFVVGLQARRAFNFFVDAYGLSADGLSAATSQDGVQSAFDLTVIEPVFAVPATETLYLPLVNR